MIDDRQLGRLRLSDIRRRLTQSNERLADRGVAPSGHAPAESLAKLRHRLVRELGHEMDRERRRAD